MDTRRVPCLRKGWLDDRTTLNYNAAFDQKQHSDTGHGHQHFMKQSKSLYIWILDYML